jgi:Cft2 family RNA processing exonuclease
MRLHFLGGANEVGASCTLVEIEGRRILVDAGIRMGVSSGAQLPNLAVLDEVGKPEAVVLTHAHTDHSGALPVLIAGLPANVPIHCTHATRAIARVLLGDAVKIMQQRGEHDGELPLYPPEAADACLARMAPVSYLSTVPICGGAIRATWVPAGHILGAASIYIEGERESLLMTGDVSVANQQTIPGMVVPQCKPDVVVMESTYGNRQHADRAQQETALALRVAEVVAAGGKVLVPAFAVGRAQEVILVLSRAMRKRQIPVFPVFVDGMVRSVNAVYAAFPDDLAPAVRRRVLRGADPFYSEDIVPVAAPADRDRVLNGPPCCIVASSGMLVGGASSYYAARMAGNSENLIAITGYQDEESPGQALLNLAKGASDDSTEPALDANERVLTLNGQRVHVGCRVETYSLSAHADGGELASLVRRLAPQSVYLVHGNADARSSLASDLDVYLPEGAHLPENGGTYAVQVVNKRRRRYGRLVRMRGLSGGRIADRDALTEVRAYVLKTGMKGPFRAQDLAEVWYGSERMDLAKLEAFKAMLDGEQPSFEIEYRRPYLYHAAGDEDAEAASGPMEVNEARARMLSSFPPEAGLFKCSAYPEAGLYELAFNFPDVIAARYGDRIRGLELETKWKIRLRETPHQGRLAEAAVDLLPSGVTALKAPALRMEKKEVTVEVAAPECMETNWDALAEAAAKRFAVETGYVLTLVRKDREIVRKTRKGPPEAWEINRAYAEIRRIFENRPHVPYKVGLKSDASGLYIEAAFISAGVGERYLEVLNGISKEIGWPIRIRQSANQEQVAQEVRRVTPEACGVRGSSKFHLAQNRVVVPVVRAPVEAEQEVLRHTFQQATGFDITWQQNSDA